MPKNPHKQDKDIRLDRHSGTGTRGLPKKEGYKGWGKLGEEDPVIVLDKNDPLYSPAQI